MPYYCVNKNALSAGEHEVHENNCNHLPDVNNQKDLGWHSDCESAVKKAKETYSNVDGCYYCCEDCHTR